MKDRHVAPVQLFRLRLDIVGETAFLGRETFLGLLFQIVRVADAFVVSPVGDRVEIHRIEIGDADFMSVREKRLPRRLDQGAVEAFRLVMGALFP
ncbi:MAG: hypothetical protein VYD85_16690 [Pseudomonadota bacterium]|nr:hypothetical protein [Pseudomonadota bacterium]